MLNSQIRENYLITRWNFDHEWRVTVALKQGLIYKSFGNILGEHFQKMYLNKFVSIEDVLFYYYFNAAKSVLFKNNLIDYHYILYKYM